MQSITWPKKNKIKPNKIKVSTIIESVIIFHVTCACDVKRKTVHLPCFEMILSDLLDGAGVVHVILVGVFEILQSKDDVSSL